MQAMHSVECAAFTFSPAQILAMILPRPRPSLANLLLIDAVCSTASVVYAVAGREASPAVILFVSVAPIVAVGLWFQKYLRQQRFDLPFDFGYLFMIGWPIVIPAFVKRSQAPKLWRFAAALLAMALAPGLAGFVGSIVMSIFRA